MNRRDFVATTAGGALGLGSLPRDAHMVRPGQAPAPRDLFPRLRIEAYVNGAAGAPLGTFADEGMQRYLDLIRMGPADGRREYFDEVMAGVRGLFADLIGASEDEVGFAESTKAGEQIVIDGLPALRRGANVVTNDLHFSGSLHNYEGLRRDGMDVRVVRADGFRVSATRMIDAMDDDTALVAVSLVSNVNGHVEDIRAIADAAHARGALVFADVIQAAGAVPIDVHAMGIDVASCSSYKWLYGIHGAGFIYANRQAQETLAGRLHPGHSRRAYGAWVPESDHAPETPYSFVPRDDATRWQPGHINYLGYAAVYEGLRFIHETGVETILSTAVRLNRRLLDQLDRERYRVLSPDLESSPILALEAAEPEGLFDRLIEAGVVISVGGDKWNQLRISPGIYNVDDDMDRLAEVLNR